MEYIVLINTNGGKINKRISESNSKEEVEFAQRKRRQH
jgi:hypothetical protein